VDCERCGWDEGMGLLTNENVKKNKKKKRKGKKKKEKRGKGVEK